MVLSNPRHERFAQELASGKPQSAAYEAAGYKPDEPNASRLTRNDKVRARVAELQTKAAVRAEITKADVLAMLIEDRKLARDLEQTSAAIRAAELLGKEIGMFVDRKEVRTGKLDGIEDDQLDALIGAVESIVAAGVPGAAQDREGQEAQGKPH